MLTSEQNAILTETGPGTPMGAVFRHYWMPALLSRELPKPDCPPKRLKLLGEEFVAFRDSAGRVGIVAARCPHRGAHLFFGRVGGVRLALRLPRLEVRRRWALRGRAQCRTGGRRADEAARRHSRAEGGGIRRPRLGLARRGGRAGAAGLRVSGGAAGAAVRLQGSFQQCNWAQACEGGLDTAHFSFLHAGIRDGERVGLHEAGSAPLRRGDNEPPSVARLRWIAEDAAPRFSVLRHAAGMLLCGARHAGEGELYWRMTQFLMPNHSLTPGNLPPDTCYANTWVPVDDASCWIFLLRMASAAPDRRRRTPPPCGWKRHLRRSGRGLHAAQSARERLPHRPRRPARVQLHRHSRHLRTGSSHRRQPGRRRRPHPGDALPDRSRRRALPRDGLGGGAATSRLAQRRPAPPLPAPTACALETSSLPRTCRPRKVAERRFGPLWGATAP